MSVGRLPLPLSAAASGSAGAAQGLRLPAAPRAACLSGLSSSSASVRLPQRGRQHLRPVGFSREPPSRLQASAQPDAPSSSREGGRRRQQQQQQPWTWQAALQRLRLPRAILPWDER